MLAVIFLAGTGVGVALEYRADLYGIRRSEGPYALEELDPAYVAELLAPTPRIANDDKVLSFDVGTFLVGGALLDRRTQIRQGETLRAQCGLIPPHEDLVCECILQDSENRTVCHLDQIVTSESLRATFNYNIGDCTSPGEYALVLKIAGEEVMRRSVTVLARSAGCLAN
jgi:hypothetical protein